MFPVLAHFQAIVTSSFYTCKLMQNRLAHKNSPEAKSLLPNLSYIVFNFYVLKRFEQYIELVTAVFYFKRILAFKSVFHKANFATRIDFLLFKLNRSIINPSRNFMRQKKKSLRAKKVDWWKTAFKLWVFKWKLSSLNWVRE